MTKAMVRKKKPLLKKATRRTAPPISIHGGPIGRPSGPSKLERLEQDIFKLRDEIAEMILLESQVEAVAVSSYEMTYEEYMELSGSVRL